MSTLTAGAPVAMKRPFYGWTIHDGLVVARRNLIQTVRVPELLFFSLVQPVIFVLLFAYVFGGAIPVPGDNDPNAYRQYLMPGIFGQTVAFAAASSTVGLAEDIVVIDHGKVIAHGTSEQLKDEIGGDRVEVTVIDADAVGRAADALRSVGNGDPLVEGLRVSAPVSGGSTVLVDAIRALDAQGVAVSDLQLRRPTLDDVFMSLTGHAAEEESA